jgi:hypothetical protein
VRTRGLAGRFPLRPWIGAALAAAAKAAVLSGCSAIQQAGESVLALQRLQFKLDGVSGGTLAGVDLSKAADPGRLSAADALRLAAARAEGAWPLSFTLDVAARNPNADGSGDKPALLSSLAWALKIDGKETVKGDIPEPITIPGAGHVTTIPLRMEVDLAAFFQDKGYEDLLNLALAVAGARGTASRLTLSAVPTVSVGGIPIRYPGTIDIVDTEFTD